MAVADPKTGQSHQKALPGPEGQVLYGKSVGDTLDGTLVGLPGYTLQVTGGSDKDGFPMRRDIPGSLKKYPLLSGGVGYADPRAGVRLRRTVRGREIGPETGQVNLAVVTPGPKPLGELLPAGEKKDKKDKKGAAGGKAPKLAMGKAPK